MTFGPGQQNDSVFLHLHQPPRRFAFAPVPLPRQERQQPELAGKTEEEDHRRPTLSTPSTFQKCCTMSTRVCLTFQIYPRLVVVACLAVVAVVRACPEQQIADSVMLNPHRDCIRSMV